MKPKISIIMPVYNAHDFLNDTISSILNQTFEKFELIIIDDGSSDDSGIICDKYAEKDSRIRVIHKQNEGICKARNLGIQLAKGEYIGFSDHDDILSSRLLEDNYRLITEYNADWVKFGKIEYIYRGQSLIKKKSSNFESRVYYANELLRQIIELRRKDLLTYVWDSFFRRSIIKEFGLTFDEKFKLGNEDIDFCQRYVRNCSKLVVNDKNYYHHYTRIGISTSSKFSMKKIESYLYLGKKSLDTFNDFKVDFKTYGNQYEFLITKYVICNIFRDLDVAGKKLSIVEKRRIINRISEDELFDFKCSFSWYSLYKISIKMALYLFLFEKKKYSLLLLIDKISRIIIYKLRSIKTRIKRVNGFCTIEN